MNSNPTLRTIETQISLDNIKSGVIPLLTAFGFVHDDEEVMDITLGKLTEETVPMTISIRKQQEVEVSRHNG